MSWTNDKQLLRRLRDLPPPPVPPGLEARLIAEVPVSRRGSGSGSRSGSGGGSRTWRVVAAAGAVSALAAGVAVLLVMFPGQGTSARVSRQDVEPSLVQQQSSTRTQETRPCDILPPLPRSS